MIERVVARDVAIVYSLTFLAGTVIGLSGAEHGARYRLAVAAANVIFSIVGFAISGAIAKTDRFDHLFQVAIGVWLLGLLNVLITSTTFFQWLLSFLMIMVTMGLGGLVSFVFVRKPEADGDVAT
jgi:hypothetical protein